MLTVQWEWQFLMRNLFVLPHYHVQRKWAAPFIFHGTASSIVDTVFVCRSSGSTLGSWLFDEGEGLVDIVSKDLKLLATAGRKPTIGDTRCIVFGHLTRMAIWLLKSNWTRSRQTAKKIQAVRRKMTTFGDPERIAQHALATDHMPSLLSQPCQSIPIGKDIQNAVSF